MEHYRNMIWNSHISQRFFEDSKTWNTVICGGKAAAKRTGRRHVFPEWWRISGLCLRGYLGACTQSWIVNLRPPTQCTWCVFPAAEEPEPMFCFPIWILLSNFMYKYLSQFRSSSSSLCLSLYLHAYMHVFHRLATIGLGLLPVGHASLWKKLRSSSRTRAVRSRHVEVDTARNQEGAVQGHSAQAADNYQAYACSGVCAGKSSFVDTSLYCVFRPPSHSHVHVLCPT